MAIPGLTIFYVDIGGIETVSKTGIMFATSLRNGFRSQLPSMARPFSNTAGLAAEVKKLGVIGAGQMVSILCTHDNNPIEFSQC